MRFVLFPLLMMILVYCFSACGTGKNSNDETTKRDYTYNEATLTCQKNGRSGINHGKVAECGLVTDKDLSGKDFSGMQLRGMTFIDCNLEGANFQGADLFGAGFIRSNLEGADLREANATSVFRDSQLDAAKLHGTFFIRFQDAGRRIEADLDNTSLTAAIIDSRTVINMTLSEALENGLVYAGADELRAQIGKIGKAAVDIQVAVEEVGGVRGAEPLSKEEFARFTDDLRRFTELKLKPGNKWYEMIFGDSNPLSLLKYVDDRINYIIAKTDTDHSSNKENTVAANFGPNYWNVVYNRRLADLGGDEKDIESLQINGEDIKLDRPRTGVVALGPAYVHLEDGQLRRNGTLVHEARHSDCPEDPSNEDLKRYLDDGKLPETSRCNYPHVSCPSGALKGLPACDKLPWGSYGVGGIFFEKIARDCENCTELERQLAMLAEKDSKSRVLVLEDMLAGKLGKPDTSSK